MTRILMLDAQVFQTVAWHRGMGKYSIELIAALAVLNKTEKRWDSIEVILSSKLPIEKGVIEAINKKIKEPKIVYLDLSADEITNAAAVMKHNRKILDDYTMQCRSNSNDIEIEYLILSPMQGGICSVFPTDNSIHKAVVFYDLIPFMFHEVYFRNKIAEIEFLTKLTELLKADVYFAISRTVANDLAVHLGVDPSRIKSIDGGPIVHARQNKKLAVSKPFVLMPTGNDLRKNNRIGIQGFNEFNLKHDNNYTLVITSYFDPDQISELSKIAENVVFTGNISGEELNYLYEECEVLLFPSEYEGLGLPVLEAVEKNRPIACSDIMVFREISRDAFQFFDPAYATEIATALDDAILMTIDKQKYRNIFNKYTWQASAQAAIEAFEKLPTSSQRIKEKITVFAPNPEGKTPISRTVQRLHSELSRQYDPVYFIEGVYTNGTPRPNMLPFVTQSLNISEDVPIHIEDASIATIYHIENSQNSTKALFTALAVPGIVVLHALDISEVWRAMVEDESLIPHDRYDFEKSLTDKFAVVGTNMLVSLISRQKAIIVFSINSKKIIDSLVKMIGVTPIVVVANYPVSSLVYRELIPFKKNIIGTVGLIAESHAMAVFRELDAPAIEKLYIADNTLQYDKARGLNISTVKAVNDRTLETNLSRLDVSFSSDDSSRIASIEASRYGVIPAFIPSTSNVGIDLPVGKIEVSGIGEFSRFVEKFTLDIRKSDITSAAQDAIAKKYSYLSFVETLNQVIDKIKKYEETV